MKRIDLPSLLFLLIIAKGKSDYLTNEIPRIGSGSCALEGMCCPGRDSSCVVQKSSPNSIIEDLNDVPCYCDHSCLILGDCCSDFKLTCGVQDCELSSWGPWSDCSQECGAGVMTRTRSVLVEPRNGGQPCSSLLQKRGCRGIQCAPQQGTRACVACEGAAQRPHLGYKCAGTGSENGHSTRFSSLREPTCHGKWKHVNSNQNCTCNNGLAQYIFI